MIKYKKKLAHVDCELAFFKTIRSINFLGNDSKRARKANKPSTKDSKPFQLFFLSKPYTEKAATLGGGYFYDKVNEHSFTLKMTLFSSSITAYLSSHTHNLY
jgi:hypothetical protein